MHNCHPRELSKRNMSKYIFILLILSNFGLFTEPIHAQDQGDDIWSWRKGSDSDSVKRTRKELDSLLTVHEAWLDDGRRGSRLNLNNAHLRSADLRGANLRFAHLDSADLSFAHLDSSDLRYAHLIDAQLRGAYLTRANLSDAALIYADLSYSQLENADLNGAHLKRAVLIGAHLSGADLTGTNLVWAQLNGSYLGLADLRGADLKYANLSKANLTGARLDTADLSGARLDSADLTDAHLRGADLRGADLSSADLSHAYLGYTDMSGADLTYATLINAIVFGADLSGADLTGAHLDSADFYAANLLHAIFSPETLPHIDRIAFTFNLNNLSFTSRSKLVELREEFSRKGYKPQERKIICSLRRGDANFVETFLFDYTSEYGSNLTQPWFLISMLYVLCSMIYYLFMMWQSNSGVTLIEPLVKHSLIHYERFITQENNLIKTVIHRKNKYLMSYPSNSYNWIPMFIRLVWWSLFFSGISAFNIGFRDINFGRWLKLLTRKI